MGKDQRTIIKNVQRNVICKDAIRRKKRTEEGIS